MQTQTLELTGMTNEHCAVKIKQALESVQGVGEVAVSFGRGDATISFDKNLVSTQNLQIALEGTGYGLVAPKPKHGEDGNCCGGCGG